MDIFRACVAIAGVCALSLAAGCSDEDDPKEMQQSPAQADAGATGGDAARPATTDASAGGIDAGGGAIPADQLLPIVFIHGFVGSAQQYESQAQRFAMNGYPLDRIRAFEHDGLGRDIAAFARDADTFIDAVMKEFGTSKIYLAGHSRGTSVTTQYMADPARAAKVAKYILLDGALCPDAPLAPCKAIRQPDLPGQKHVEVSTSQASFERQFEFLFGKKPAASAIVAQGPTAKISGRIVNFPENTGRVGTLELWEVATETGARVGAQPVAKFEIGASGDFGPVEVKTDKHYEFVMSAPGVTGQHHFYQQRFLRDSRFVRLLSGPPDTATRMNTNTSENHVAITVSRQREWTVDDKLEISVNSAAGNQPPVNIINPMFKMSIGIHLHDDVATPKMTSLAGLEYFNGVPGTANMGQPFQAGYDVYMPAANPTNGTVTIRAVPREATDKPQTLNIPNWPSAGHTNAVVFADYAQ